MIAVILVLALMAMVILLATDVETEDAKFAVFMLLVVIAIISTFGIIGIHDYNYDVHCGEITYEDATLFVDGEYLRIETPGNTFYEKLPCTWTKQQ